LPNKSRFQAGPTPEIDAELAAGRALVDLGNRLTRIGSTDAEGAAVNAAIRAVG